MTDNSIKFSIIIPTFNRASFIDKAINSLLTQTYPSFELIVIDDGSTDNTEEVVKSFIDKRITYIRKPNKERAAARNSGKQVANGHYLTFFDSDDLLYPHHLETAYNLIKNKNHPKWFHLGYDVKSENGELIKTENTLRNNPNLDLINGNFLSCNGVFLSKNLANQFSFNEDRDLSALEDWELWLRIAAEHKIILSSEITSTIVNHDSRSVLITDKTKIENRFKVFLKYTTSNTAVLTFYKDHLHLLKASCFTYLSLHLALSKNHKKDSLRYLFLGLKYNFKILLSRRFFAIIKHLLK